ncbi:hypothetical protein NXC14_PC00362 (plasmid) [Rhizobium sp. NXC14]|nr:hypothetical protein NXC14_PC00362 [Rhizobium sp. NXC14]
MILKGLGTCHVTTGFQGPDCGRRTSSGAGHRPAPADNLIVWTDPVMALVASVHPSV